VIKHYLEFYIDSITNLEMADLINLRVKYHPSEYENKLMLCP